MSAWLTVIAIGVGTYAARLSFIGVMGERRFPPAFEGALRFVAPAVFAALILPEVLLSDGSVEIAPAANPRFLAAALAGVIAWRFKSVGAVIVVGMSALWILEAIT